MTFSIPGWLATLLAALVGVGALLYVHGLNARRAAAAKLHAAFSGALGIIAAAVRHASDDPARPSVSTYLRQNFQAHAAAVAEFRPFVSSSDLAAYQKAWQQHAEFAYDKHGVSATFLAEGVAPDAPLTVLQSRIHAILAFAKI
jgi:hypothetical protein